MRHSRAGLAGLICAAGASLGAVITISLYLYFFVSDGAYLYFSSHGIPLQAQPVIMDNIVTWSAIVSLGLALLGLILSISGAVRPGTKKTPALVGIALSASVLAGFVGLLAFGIANGTVL